MKGYKNSTKTVYETEESDYASGYRSGKDFYPKSRTASSLTPSEKGGSVGKIARGIVRATVIKPTDALVKALSHTGVLTDDDGTKASPAYVKGQLKARKDTVGYAEGGSVKKPKTYDPVKDEPTSRPLTADQVRNLRNRMKASPKKRAYDPVLDEPTSRPFAKGGKVMRKAEGGPVAPPFSPYDSAAVAAARQNAVPRRDPAVDAEREADRQAAMRAYSDRENAAIDARQAAQERRGVAAP